MRGGFNLAKRNKIRPPLNVTLFQRIKISKRISAYEAKNNLFLIVNSSFEELAKLTSIKIMIF